MTSNEAVRCPDCGRPHGSTAWPDVGQKCFKQFRNSTFWIADCASYAKAKAVPAVDVEKEREAFERYMRAEEDCDDLQLRRCSDGEYGNSSVREMWRAWKAARAESSKAVPAEGQRVEEPYAWVLTAPNGNVRLWTRDRGEVPLHERDSAIALYTRPASIAEGFSLPSDEIVEGWIAKARGRYQGDLRQYRYVLMKFAQWLSADSGREM